MIVVNQKTALQWQTQGIDTQVITWFKENDEKHVSDCTSALNLTVQQVWWALHQQPMEFILLPESDAESLQVLQLDRTMHGS